MQRFKRLGVFLHSSPSDEAALAFAGQWASLAKSETLLCVHVHEQEQEEEEIDRETFEQHVRQALPEAIADITRVELHVGKGVAEILRSARDLDLDMIVVGRRLPSDHLGIGAALGRLARKAPCNVLCVPRGARPHFGRILVAVDFSKHAQLALEQGISIARASGEANPQVLLHSNSIVGYGYKKLGKSLAETVAEREQTLKQKLCDFVGNMNTEGVQIDCACTCSESTEAAILETAVARKMDLVVAGSKGTGSMFLLGSTTERLVHESMLPVLIVKEKGETLQILEALFAED